MIQDVNSTLTKQLRLFSLHYLSSYLVRYYPQLSSSQRWWIHSSHRPWFYLQLWSFRHPSASSPLPFSYPSCPLSFLRSRESMLQVLLFLFRISKPPILQLLSYPLKNSSILLRLRFLFHI